MPDTHLIILIAFVWLSGVVVGVILTKNNKVESA